MRKVGRPGELGCRFGRIASLGAVGLIACSVAPVEREPLGGGAGVPVTSSGAITVIGIDPSAVPVVQECSPGQFVRKTASGWACAGGPETQARWTDVMDRPPGLADGRDDDALADLACADDEVHVRGPAGAWTCVVPMSVSTSVAWTRLDGVPAHIADGDDDTLRALASSCNDRDLAKWRASGEWACAADASPSGAQIERWATSAAIDLDASSTVGGQPISTGAHVYSLPWTSVTGKPPSLADGADDDLAMDLGCTPGDLLGANGAGAWTCATDETLDEAAVDAHLAGRYANAASVHSMQAELQASAGPHADLATRLAERQARVAELVRRLAALSRPAGYVRLPAGTFVMGSPPDEPGRDPGEVQHTVTITRPFWLKTTEVTQAQWQALMGNNPSLFAACGADCPAETVTWFEAVAYVNARSRAENLQECYVLSGCDGNHPGAAMRCDSVAFPHGTACTGYRLPTEAEWEYAARAGTQSAIWSGDLAFTVCELPEPALARVAWYRSSKRSGAVRLPASLAMSRGHRGIRDGGADWRTAA